MVKIFITQQAKEDLKNIKVYIQKDSYQNSIKVLQTLNNPGIGEYFED
jgi:hypothetical protein